MATPRRHTSVCGLWFGALRLVLGLAVFSGLASGALAQGSTDKSKEIAAAHTAWQREAAKLRTQLQQLHALCSEFISLHSRVDARKAELAALAEERRRTLDEMRRGQFCSGCGQTRSEILAKGERFPHPGEREVPATPQQIRNAEQRFDSRLQALQQQLRATEAERGAKANDADSFLHQIRLTIPQLHIHLSQERDLHYTAWADAKRVFETEIAQARSELENLERSRRAERDPTELKLLESRLRVLQERLLSSTRRGQAAYARAEELAEAFRRGADGQLQSLDELAAGLPKHTSLPDGWFLGKSITGVPRGLQCNLLPLDDRGSNALVRAAERDAGNQSTPTKKSVRDLLEGK
jgi:hypothetical protein